MQIRNLTRFFALIGLIVILPACAGKPNVYLKIEALGEDYLKDGLCPLRFAGRTTQDVEAAHRGRSECLDANRRAAFAEIKALAGNRSSAE